MQDASEVLDDTDLLNARMLLIASEQGKTLSNILELPNAKNPYMDYPLHSSSEFTSDYLAVCSSESIPMKGFRAFPFVFATGAADCLHFLKHSSFLKNLDDAHYNEVPISFWAVIISPCRLTCWFLNVVLLHFRKYSVM